MEYIIMPNHIHLIVVVGTGFCPSANPNHPSGLNQPIVSTNSSESNQSDDQKVVPTFSPLSVNAITPSLFPKQFDKQVIRYRLTLSDYLPYLILSQSHYIVY